LQYQQNRANEELIIKKRTLLMDEFKAGLWTINEYRQKVDALESGTTGTQASQKLQRKFSRSSSIGWDIEKEDGTLPEESD
jgi:hypothetical protein